MYAPLLGRFISPDSLVPGIENPQAWNRYSYVYNRPLNLTDPSGHCPICVTALGGAIIGGLIAYGSQVAVNMANHGLSADAFTQVDLSQVGAGIVAGAIGGATFGVGTAVLGTGAVATVASGALAGVAAGQAGRAAENVLSGQARHQLGNVSDIALDAALGGGLAAAGYGVSRLARGNVPTLEIDPNVTPNIADNIASAQAAGKPRVLHRLTDPVRIAQNRREAIRSYTGSGSPDEYPFASTYEGGIGAQVRGVPLNEQRIQGGKLASFYRKNNIRDGDAFKVVVKRR